MAELIAAAEPKAAARRRLQAAGDLRRQQGRGADRARSVSTTRIALDDRATTCGPVLERENLGPARDAIHDLFMEHVMAHAPGYKKLMTWTDAPIMPTPGAVGHHLQTIAKREGINVVGVDIGGATTDVF